MPEGRTGPGRRAAACLLVLLAALPLAAQFSPGKLAEPHAHLEGLSNCTRCHLLGEKVSGDKCLECHKALSRRIKAEKGYHASDEVRGKECIQCHSDHHGREFKLVRFDDAGFNHTKTGFELTGKHAAQDCKSCHKPANISDPELKGKSATYLGLDPSCLSCHNDYHLGSLGSDCVTCHDFRAFRPAPKFNHDRTGFPLVGSHRKVDCAECHKKSVQNGIETQEFAGVAYANCTNCHRDVHENKFGQNCVQCHTEESFHRIRQTANFRHSMTPFPLEGKHRSVACAACHGNNLTAPLKHDRCADCHADYHRQQFVRGGSSPDCAECHTTMGFENTLYTVEQHKRSPFKLAGAHLATPCFSCHKKTGSWSFREIGTRCADCHADVHEAYLDKKYYPDRSCENCHDPDTWTKIAFDHERTGYRLEGAHLLQACRACHFRKDEGGTRHQVFAKLTASCFNCHRDVHYGQFDEADGTWCLRCHGYADWSPSRFDHDHAAFKLTGKHRDVACNKCHLPVVSAGITYTQYKLNDFSCEACH